MSPASRRGAGASDTVAACQAGAAARNKIRCGADSVAAVGPLVPAATVLPLIARQLGVPGDVCAGPLPVRTLAVTQRERNGIVGKHLLDETAEFRMPRTGRHAAADDELERTQRIERAPSQPPAPEDDEAR
jgi:hypothetical protein